MFDADIKLFDVHFPTNEVRENALVLNGCNAYLKKNYDSNDVYSELEEMSYAYLNFNNYDQRIEVEFCFFNNQDEPYQKFWAKCYAFRTDKGLRHKVNGIQSVSPSFTKVSMNNEIVLGIGLYINEETYTALLEANAIVIEGAIALGKKTNVYYLSVKLQKDNNEFKIIYANTFKQMDKRSIDSLCH